MTREHEERSAIDVALDVQRAAAQVDGVHQFHGEACLCGFTSSRARSRTEHITQAIVAQFNAKGASDE